MIDKEDSIGADLLLKGHDPEPVELVHQHSSCPLLLICEHGGQEIPQSLGDLGLSAEQRMLHIAYDIGAKEVALAMSVLFRCTLILQRYSRLVIDCNRPPGTSQSIPETSDSISVPGNRTLSGDARKKRELSIFMPYADLCKSQIMRKEIGFTFSIHTFTPAMAGVSRVWDIGFLFRKKCSDGSRLAELCHEMWPDLNVGHNEPYSIEDLTDWYIPVCAEPRNIPHCLIEIRNDHVRTEHECAFWAQRLHQLISRFMERTHGT